MHENEGESEVAQSYPTLTDPMDCSLPGSSVHGIFQARVLEWVAIAFSLDAIENWKDVFRHLSACLTNKNKKKKKEKELRGYLSLEHYLDDAIILFVSE